MPNEWVLNSAANRFQLNFKRNVGAVSEEIRKCSPRTVGEWENFYYANVRDKKHIDELGKKLFVKISEVLVCEINQVTKEDCIRYMHTLVIDRTFDGYQTEIKTVYGQLQNMIGSTIEPAPDEWDRLFNVDFFIKIREAYIGIQIKPISDTSAIPEIFKERQLQLKTHEKFTKKYSGKVFYIFSTKVNGKKTICNPEVADEIRNEIKRLTDKSE